MLVPTLYKTHVRSFSDVAVGLQYCHIAALIFVVISFELLRLTQVVLSSTSFLSY